MIFCGLLIGLSLLIPQVQSATADAENTVSSRVIETRIEAVRADSELTEDEKTATLSLLQDALLQNQRARESAALSKEYELVLADPSAYSQASRLPAIAPLTPETLANATQQQLSSLIQERQIALAALVERKKTLEADIRSERTADTPRELATLRSEAPPLGNRTAEDNELSAEKILDIATDSARLARIRMLEKRALSRSVRLEQWQEELDYIAAQSQQVQNQLEELQLRNSSARQTAAGKRTEQIQGLIDQLEASGNIPPADAETATAKILERADELEALEQRAESLKREAASARETRSRLQQRVKSVTQQLDLFQFNVSADFGAALRAQRDQITGTKAISSRVARLEVDLTQGRLRQFQLDDLHLQKRFDETIEGTNQIERELATIDAELINELAIGYANYVQDLNSLAAEDRRYVEESEAYTALLDQNLLWIPSTNRIGLDSLRALPKSIRWLGSLEKWQVSLREAWQEIVRRPLPLLLLVLTIGLLMHRRVTFKNALLRMEARVGKVNLDSHSLTFTAAAITLLLAAPGALALYFLSRLVDGPTEFGRAMANALAYGALLYLILDVLLQSVRKSGLARVHFRWQNTTVEALRSNLPWFMTLFIPAIILNLLVEQSGTAEIRDSLGRIAFVFATTVLAVFAYRTMSPERGIFRNAITDQGENPWHIKFLAFPLLVLLPALIAGLSAYGYHYTAIQLGAYFLNSLLLVLIGLLAFYLAERAISINERRLSLARVRAKRAAAVARSEDQPAALAAGEGLPSEIEVEEIDLQTLSVQTRELLRVIIGLALGFALWNLWSDLLPAFKPLSNVHLWGGVAAPEDGSFSGGVTLWELILALTAASLTFIAARNIPSLLEVTVLSRLTLEPGTNYAATTLARYIIVITGSVVTLQLLGAQWSKLQWLVAALSVGLGFGLQEIVANFVSGIVLLFERPIRIGDTVTVGDQFGTVSRIRIRATTILDWDRREIVIPNKTFITERLINWTLTDPITRTILRVGVAYGSDVDLTEELLYEVASQNEGVLSDPPPVVVFNDFGESSLDFELRVFVRGVRDLIPVKHELNKAIDLAFRENHIEIAFPQRDLHLDAKTIDVQIIDPDPEKPSALAE